MLENNSLTWGIQKANYYAFITFHQDSVNDAVNAYDFLEKIQDTLIKKGTTLQYIPGQYVHEYPFCNEIKDDEVVIWTPHITKKWL